MSQMVILMPKIAFYGIFLEWISYFELKCCMNLTKYVTNLGQNAQIIGNGNKLIDRKGFRSGSWVNS